MEGGWKVKIRTSNENEVALVGIALEGPPDHLYCAAAAPGVPPREHGWKNTKLNQWLGEGASSFLTRPWVWTVRTH